jgi:hypothetical protein
MAELLPMVFHKGTLMKLRTVLFALLLSTLSSSSQELQRKLEVLTSAEADPSRLLPPPPTDGSDNQQKELAEVRRLVKTRTPERYKQAVWDNEHEDPTAFAATIGPRFDLNKLPATAKLLAAVMNDSIGYGQQGQGVLPPQSSCGGRSLSSLFLSRVVVRHGRKESRRPASAVLSERSRNNGLLRWHRVGGVDA